MSVKTVGILGGYGPYATNDFYKELLDNTQAKKDWEHLHVVLDVNPRIPSRARSFLFNEENPTPYMLQGIERLKKAGADFFVCPCNTAHHFLMKVQDKFTLPFVNMIDATVAQILSDGKKKIGVMGSEVTVMAKLYEDKLTEAGVEVVNVEKLEDVRLIIEAGKQNKNLDEAKEVMMRLINDFTDKNVDAVIYACTELPIILPTNESPIQVYDSSHILATETIKEATK